MAPTVAEVLKTTEGKLLEVLMPWYLWYNHLVGIHDCARLGDIGGDPCGLVLEGEGNKLV